MGKRRKRGKQGQCGLASLPSIRMSVVKLIFRSGYTAFHQMFLFWSLTVH
ncbi:MAG: hypothetical protein LBU32_15995 [Clostridiales bacterium]|nr:hypothetical protein [Clostridiales bacterium]